MKSAKKTTTEKERLTSHNYEKVIQDLIEKIDILENRLKDYGAEKIKLITSYKQLEEENAFLKLELDKNIKNFSNLEQNKFSYIEKINTLTSQNKSMIDTYKTKFDIISRELQQKSYEIENLKEEIKEKNEKIKSITVKNTISMYFSDSAKDNLLQEITTTKNQKKKIDELEKEIDDLYMQKKNEGNLILENEHLKEDNIRLLNMLKNTDEYEDFGYLNSTLPGGIRFVNEPSKKITRRIKAKNTAEINKHLNCWVPAEAFNIMQNFKNMYNLDISNQIIDDVLSSLNKLWKEREDKRIIKTKIKYQKEIVDLKQKYGIPVYEMNEEEKENNKNLILKNKNLEKKNNFDKAFEKNNEKISKNLILNSKKNANKFNESKKELNKEISNLKKQINANNMVNQKMDRDKFILEKNEIIIDKVIDEFSNIEFSFEELLKKYYERVKDTDTMISGNNNPLFNIKMINSSVKWLFNSFKTSLDESKKKFNLWKNEYNQA